MDETMLQFSEKLAGLVELGKKNKNFLEYAQIETYFKDFKLTSDMMEAIFDYLEQNGGLRFLRERTTKIWRSRKRSKKKRT